MLHDDSEGCDAGSETGAQEEGGVCIHRADSFCLYGRK